MNESLPENSKEDPIFEGDIDAEIDHVKQVLNTWLIKQKKFEQSGLLEKLKKSFQHEPPLAVPIFGVLFSINESGPATIEQVEDLLRRLDESQTRQKILDRVKLVREYKREIDVSIADNNKNFQHKIKSKKPDVLFHAPGMDAPGMDTPDPFY